MKSHGEQLMCDYLEVYLEGEEHIDNYRPVWLTNPETGQPLEIDRYYPKFKVGYEYQGEQHLRQVEGMGDIDYRRKLDGLKARLAMRQGVKIIPVEAIDLQVHKMFHMAKRAYSWRDKNMRPAGESRNKFRRTAKRHKKAMSPRMSLCKELGKRSTAYRKWLETTYGEQISTHKRTGDLRKRIEATHGISQPMSWFYRRVSGRNPVPADFIGKETKCESCGELVLWLPSNGRNGMPVELSSVKEGDTDFKIGEHVTHFGVCKKLSKFVTDKFR